MDLRAPVRPLARTERSAWVWSVGIVTALALVGGIAVLQLQTDVEHPQDASEAVVEPREPNTAAYVYRCSNGDLQATQCIEGAAPSTSPSSRSTFSTYTAPRLAETSAGRRLLAEADVRYRREVQAAQSRPTPYEETVAITQSSECRQIRQEREHISAAMRRGYEAQLGEHYRRRDYALRQSGIRAGCWTGSKPADHSIPGRGSERLCCSGRHRILGRCR